MFVYWSSKYMPTSAEYLHCNRKIVHVHCERANKSLIVKVLAEKSTTADHVGVISISVGPSRRPKCPGHCFLSHCSLCSNTADEIKDV